MVTPSLKVPAKLQRMSAGTGSFPVVEHLHRDESLFAALEWQWKSEREGSYVFEDYAEAESAAKLHGGFPVCCERPAETPAVPSAETPPLTRDSREVADALDRRRLW